MAFAKPRPKLNNPHLEEKRNSRPRVLTTSAIYHVGGCVIISAMVFLGVTAVFLPLHIPTLEITASQFESWLSMARCDCATLFPSQLALVQDSPSLLNEVCKLKDICYIGGKQLLSVIRLWNAFLSLLSGSTYSWNME